MQWIIKWIVYEDAALLNANVKKPDMAEGREQEKRKSKQSFDLAKDRFHLLRKTLCLRTRWKLFKSDKENNNSATHPKTASFWTSYGHVSNLFQALNVYCVNHLTLKCQVLSEVSLLIIQSYALRWCLTLTHPKPPRKNP
ncbi:Neuronal Acetylcholine Receptor Subunit Alpha-5 [Manis pentadactyla]|nr:Neuronal Acetylcholine Receptor Subunit Alpha-5 [Manis pentadactyla]